MGDHRSAWTALQRLVTGVPVPEDQVERAVTHLASCDEHVCLIEPGRRPCRRPRG